MNIHLHIERLILDGLPVETRDGGIVRSAVEVELTRLLSAGGLAKSLATGGAFASLPANTMQASDARPQPLGQQIARAVYSGIGATIVHTDSKRT